MLQWRKQLQWCGNENLTWSIIGVCLHRKRDWIGSQWNVTNIRSRSRGWRWPRLEMRMCPLDRDLKDNDKDKEHGKRGQGWKQGQGHDHYLDLTLQIKRCCSRCFHFLDRGKLLCRPRCKALLCSQPATKTNNFQPNSQLASAHKYKYKCKNNKLTKLGRCDR